MFPGFEDSAWRGLDALTSSFLFLLESDGSTRRCLVVALFVLLEVTGSNVLPL